MKTTIAAIMMAMALAGCDTAEAPTTPMNADDIPENQGMGGTFDGNPGGIATGIGIDRPANTPAEDSSSADGTTPMQQQP
ncbi:hypothetical protein [Novosphingobium sp. CECT 9465]|uniref:hypothetical protein n=1 Tax=Novosphingobium sp. CECT 9465 TaxID=2829794 RepID=UPI001E3DF104|nr:hypothetical protein [Novosphingobium sp. CECT 9465]CAH0496285.1 hypothetical protein NVSP9465_01316 [Novosphingobium sp. CECT 9465]